MDRPQPNNPACIPANSILNEAPFIFKLQLLQFAKINDLSEKENMCISQFRHSCLIAYDYVLNLEKLFIAIYWESQFKYIPV